MKTVKGYLYRLRHLPLLTVVTLCLFSCASSYKPFALANYDYQGRQTIVDSVFISLRPDLQRRSDNGWYAKKERKYGMRALGIKIENRSGVPIAIKPDDIAVYVGNDKRRIFLPDEYSAKVKQRVAIHLLHTLYGPWVTVTQTGPYGNLDTDVYFIPVGAVIGIINATKASKANRANAQDIRLYQIWNRTINPGETLYGVILVEGAAWEDYQFRPDAVQ